MSSDDGRGALAAEAARFAHAVQDTQLLRRVLADVRAAAAGDREERS